MAADRPFAERGIVEIKMGRSKFPGKPSKIGNRKRVNLSSCALPDDNDSSKAAKNIYLGLSVFNETFGDNEMVAPGPFHGFSLAEVEVAMAEARLQQNEAEVEHKKQGISVNFWDGFQNELFSIIGCSTDTNTAPAKNHEVNKTKLSFDGGGLCKIKEFPMNSSELNDNQPSKTSGIKSGGHKPRKIKNISSSSEKKRKTVRFKLTKLQSPNKSLQSQAAKKLLEKAKMSNLLENNKNNSVEKKFILPSYSIRSSRIIKPNKRFLEENLNRRKITKRLNNNCASDSKKTKVHFSESLLLKFATDKKSFEELRIDVGSEETKRKASKIEDNSCLNESSRTNSQVLNTGKVILRKARLQLDNNNLSLLEGPFSSSSASSLSPNSQLKVNLIQSAVVPGSIVCGVCGVVRFYRIVDIAKKFGIYCCESCRKFISKIIKTCDVKKSSKFQCVKGKGLCGILPVVDNVHFKMDKGLKNSRCQACWLKLCLKNFNMPIKLKQRLLKLLPVNMQIGLHLELSPVVTNDIGNKFMMGSNIKDFKWLNENSNNSNEVKSLAKDSFNDKQLSWSKMDATNEKCLRNRNKTIGNENRLKLPAQNGKAKTESDEKIRQSIAMKGPRVKHVCRSASVVLGQPLATFPSELSPTKKQTSDDECKNCDEVLTTNNCIESQNVIDKRMKEVALPDGKYEKKSKAPNSKTSFTVQTSVIGKPKKKTNTKAENPISMDFWESYDPDEVCETGFGLIGSESFSVRALCFLCGSSGQEKLIHCASCCEPYHEFCVDEGPLKLENSFWRYDWVCPRCTVCFTCGRTSGQQLKCIKCNNSFHTECVDRVGGRLLHSPDRPWVCSVCLRCKSCNGVDVSVFVGNLPLCKTCFVLRQKGNYCPLCQRCYEDDDYDSKMMECGQCKCWVHAKCEGLSDEKYQVLSFLPESVEYVCRMCCAMPPAPWWIAVEAELKSGYLGVLKALSKNRKACTMLKWSPRKQCTCRQINFVSRTLDFEEKAIKSGSDICKNENIGKEENKFFEQVTINDRDETFRPANVTERKTSIEVISHPTESLKLTLKIMKETESDEREKVEISEEIKREEKRENINDKFKDSTVRVKKCPSNEENSEDSLANTFDCQDDSQISLPSLFKRNEFGLSSTELGEKQRSLSSPLNAPSDSGIGSTDDELKASCLMDEEGCRLDENKSNSNRVVEIKPNCDTSVSFLEEKHECFCFLEVDTYNSRSKPFSPNLMSIKKKVTTSEYSSLHQFHQDMQGMIATTQSVELMDLYHQTMKEIFPWFDPKFSRVQSNTHKVSGSMSLESTPVKNTPTKVALLEECKIPQEKLSEQCLDYFYSNHIVEDNRVCLMCKIVGDGPPGDTGRLLYCGQNEWVHCNCALWSGEVFEEIDGSLQNVHSAINRGRSIRCPECNLKGASIGCCARNCQETYHFRCARQVGCTFMDDKTVYCPAHVKESIGKLVQKEKEFEIRRPVYVELDKRKMKVADSSQIRFAVGALQVNNLGKFVIKLSDQPEGIIPELFDCTRLFWSCFEPWRIVRYHFTVRVLEVEDLEGIDCGVNLTIDHSKEPNVVELKLKQLRHFLDHNTFLDINEKVVGERTKENNKLSESKFEENSRIKINENLKVSTIKKSKKDQMVVKRIFDHFDSKDEENCLSDNQNTADLLPPDIEEAIFNDLPHDILDGISMQDIFMDIKNDTYENVTKEGIIAEDVEGEEISESSLNRSKKTDNHPESVNHIEFWSEITDDTFTKPSKDLKKLKSDVLSHQQPKKSPTLKTYRKSCGLNWNCKTEGTNNKWRKNSKCHVTVNLLEPQERGNMLQELKFTDGLVSVSTGAIDSVKDLKARLEDGKRSIQQEEGKENKCLPWHTHLQPRLLQVDGGVDSSSSGSEAGESPQRLIEENINSKIVTLPQSSPYLNSPVYSLNSPMYSEHSSYASKTENSLPEFTSNYSEDYKHSSYTNTLPQLDGVSDLGDDSGDSENFCSYNRYHKRPRQDQAVTISRNFEGMNFKINQCDGGIDSESDEEISKCSFSGDLPFLETNKTKDEPVKCSKCHCTYRTKISYQRHLERCCTDFMLSSSEGEMSEEESPKKQSRIIPKAEISPLPKVENKTKEMNVLTNQEISSASSTCTTQISNPALVQGSESAEKLEVKKEKTNKRTYARKKPTLTAKKPSVVGNFQQVQQILVQQPSTTPTLIVQDISTQNMVPTAFIDSGPTLGYLTTVDAQNPYGKSQIIATPNGIIQLPTAPEAQIIGGLCLNPQNLQPSFIIQQSQPPGALITSQPGPIVMPGEQMMMGPTGLFDIVQDPGTGGMFLTSHNQPLFYNMETIVSNTVMQTNQFMSNVLATSYSQTSTQIFQAREYEQVVNLPSNYIVMGANPPVTEKIISPDDLLCVRTPQTLIPNQSTFQIPNQTIFNSTHQVPQTISAEPKIISSPLNPLRCLQPLHVKQVCPSIVFNKVSNQNTQIINQPATQVFRPPEISQGAPCQEIQVKGKSLLTNKNPGTSQFRSVPMMRPNVTKSPSKGLEKALATPKSKVQGVHQRSRALVDYINNFRSDSCDSLPVKENVTQNQLNELQNSVYLKSNSQLGSSSSEISKSAPTEFFAPCDWNASTSFTSTSCAEVNKTQLQPPTETTSFYFPIQDSSFSNSVRDSKFSNSPNSTPPTVQKSKLPEILPTSEAIDPKMPTKNFVSSPPKILVNMTNSLPFDREDEISLNMPSLEDSPIPNETLQTSPKNENQTNEILPLQENLQSINTGCKTATKSPQKSSPVKNSPSSEEKTKCRKKIISFDQNSLDTTHLAENSSKGKSKEENVQKRVKNGKYKKSEEKGPKLIFDVTSDDGFKSSSTSMVELWANICDSVQEMRAVLKVPPLPVSRKGHEILGMQNHGLQHCLEQLRGVDQCIKYKCKYFVKDENRKDEEYDLPLAKENLSGCARTEKFTTRKEFDMFAWLASKHRRLPKLTESAEETLSSIRRANSLPMAMKYRNLKETAKLYVGVYRSKIHGKGLFCLREIEAGEMVIEYAGEVIRSTLTDKREKHYTDKGIGCYMFRIDDHFVIDATMKGNAARFINHSCEPNCYSRVVDILGKKHIVIFALRRINIMEELTYDYKFPFEDEKISCHCLSKKCRKYLN